MCDIKINVALMWYNKKAKKNWKMLSIRGSSKISWCFYFVHKLVATEKARSWICSA